MRPLIAAVLTAATMTLSAQAFSETLTWAGCGITKKAFMAELANAYKRKYGTTIKLEGGGAAKGIRRVGSKSADIGGTCRPKLRGNPEELVTRLNPVAWDALVVIVNKDNPVSDISLEQVKKLYRGEIKNWTELGGPDKPVELMIRRGRHSGVGRTLRELVFANHNMRFVGKKKFPSTGPLEKEIESNPNSIGITGISSAHKRNVKILALEGKQPNYANIKSGQYLMYRPLYITYNPSSPKRREVERFINFAHSSEGRDIIRNQGVVPYLDAIDLTRKQRQQWRDSWAADARGG